MVHAHLWTKEVDAAMNKDDVPPDEVKKYVAKWTKATYTSDEISRVSDKGYTPVTKEYWIPQVCVLNKPPTGGFKYVNMPINCALKMYSDDTFSAIADPCDTDDEDHPLVDGRILLYVKKPLPKYHKVCPVPGGTDHIINITQEEHKKLSELPVGISSTLEEYLSAVVIDHKMPETSQAKKTKVEELRPYTSFPDLPEDIERKEILAHLKKTAKYHTAEETGKTIVVKPIKD